MVLTAWDFDDDAMGKVELSLMHYLDQLMAGFFDSDSGGYYYGTVSGLPFCGCTTCLSREVLAWLVPRLGDLYKRGQLWQQDG